MPVVTVNTIRYGIIQVLNTNFTTIPILGEEIKQGLAPGMDLQLPCFFIKLLTVAQTQELNVHYNRTHTFDIHYFASFQKNRVMHDVAEQLYDALDLINIDGLLYRATGMTHEIIDEVLHFFVDYNFKIVRETPIDPIMQTMDQDGFIKGQPTTPPIPPEETTVLYDSFNRPDGPMGAADTGQSWGNMQGNWGIVANKVQMIAGSGSYNHSLISANISDCNVEVNYSIIEPASPDPVLIFRYSDTGNSWFVLSEMETYQIYKMISGVSYAQSIIPIKPANNDTIKVELLGSQIKLRINGDLKEMINDSFNETAILHGIGTTQPGSIKCRFDDFKITAFA